MAIQKLDNNKEKRLHFIKELQSLHWEHKYGSKELSLGLADLVMCNASKCWCF